MKYAVHALNLHPGHHFAGVDIKTFAEASLLLIQPLEDFFNNVFVMAVSVVDRCFKDTYIELDVAGLINLVMVHGQEDEKIRNNRLALLRKVAGLTKGIADLSVLPGF